jgi:hypothetical protein
LCVLWLVLGGRAAWGDSSLSASVLASRDDQGYQHERYQAQWGRETPGDGQRVSLRWHRYALGTEFAGVLPFSGGEPAVDVGGHLLRGSWWLAAAAGFQGRVDRHGATGELVVARALPTLAAGTFTPRLEATRAPVVVAALPLSLGLIGNRAQAVLAWRTDRLLAEGGARVDFWDSITLPGRVRNGALDVIEANRLAILHGYLLTQRGQVLDWGFAAKAAWAQHNTLLPTRIQPWQYSWYPASAPPFAWETALVLRAQTPAHPSLAAAIQLQLPLLSRETRQWDSIRRADWGTAPYEGKLEGSWWFLASTAVQLDAVVFAKPWERWNPAGVGAYRHVALQLSLKQRI